MAHSDDDNEDWVACPPGTLRAAAASLQEPASDTRRRFLAGVATGVVVAAIGLGLVSARQSFYPTHISCSECQALLHQFASSDLSPELATRVERHLSDCPTCQTVYHSMRSTVSQLRRPVEKSTRRQLVALVDHRHREAVVNQGVSSHSIPST